MLALINFDLYIQRIPVYYPPGYTSFNELPPGHNPFQRPSPDTEPTQWMINLDGKNS